MRSAPLRQKTSAQFGRHDGTEIVFLAKDAVANSGYEIVNRISDRPGKYCGESGDKAPKAADVAEDVDESAGTSEDAAAGGENDDAIREVFACCGRDNFFDCVALQRRELKDTGTIASQDEFHRAVAEGAVAVVEDDFGRRGVHHSITIQA